MSPRYDVLLTAGAERDMESIYDYLNTHDSPASANRILDHLLELTESLSAFPERGSIPQELRVLGIRDYRQVLLKPHRVIYRVHGQKVYIYLIADERRDLQFLLEQRLLGG